MNYELMEAAERYGISVPQQHFYERNDVTGKMVKYAYDAQPPLLTQSNAGIPAFLANWLDPESIRVLVEPDLAALIAGEEKKGDWTFDTTQFPVTEATGHVSSYSDFGSNGMATSNTNWVTRESYHFEVTTIWGTRELERYGNARINRAAELDLASSMAISKFFNRSYLYGVAGRKLYGYLNDPNLGAPITPATTPGGQVKWADKPPEYIHEDMRLLFSKLVSQVPGHLDANSTVKFVMSPLAYMYFIKPNNFGVIAKNLFAATMPNAEFMQIPNYSTDAGELIQVYAPSLDATSTAGAAFTEKMRAFPVVTHESYWTQKKAAGTWGAIIKRPVAVAQMLGV